MHPSAKEKDIIIIIIIITVMATLSGRKRRRQVHYWLCSQLALCDQTKNKKNDEYMLENEMQKSDWKTAAVLCNLLIFMVL